MSFMNTGCLPVCILFIPHDRNIYSVLMHWKCMAGIDASLWWQSTGRWGGSTESTFGNKATLVDIATWFTHLEVDPECGVKGHYARFRIPVVPAHVFIPQGQNTFILMILYIKQVKDRLDQLSNSTSWANDQHKLLPERPAKIPLIIVQWRCCIYTYMAIYNRIQHLIWRCYSTSRVVIYLLSHLTFCPALIHF